MTDLPGGVQSVEARHRKVEKGQVRTQVASKLDGLASIGGLPHHLELRWIEQGLDALSKDVMVVCEKDARHVQAGCQAPSSLRTKALLTDSRRRPVKCPRPESLEPQDVARGTEVKPAEQR